MSEAPTTEQTPDTIMADALMRTVRTTRDGLLDQGVIISGEDIVNALMGVVGMVLARHPSAATIRGQRELRDEVASALKVSLTTAVAAQRNAVTLPPQQHVVLPFERPGT